MAGATADFTYTAPECLDRVMADFPRLTIFCSQGGWPWVQEIVSLAFRRPNLYLCPDTYLLGLPGTDDYIRAANGFLSDQMLFGTAYPFCPLEEYVSRFRQLPLKPEAMETMLWRNAHRLLAMPARGSGSVSKGGATRTASRRDRASTLCRSCCAVDRQR